MFLNSVIIFGVSFYCPPPPQSGAGDMEMPGVCPLVHPSVRDVVSALRLLFVDQLISNLHTSIILGISSLSSKLGKIRKQLWEWRPFLRCLPKQIQISKCYNFNENWYWEDFRSEECNSDKCDLKMAAIAAIMVAILAAIFNMVAKTHKQFRSAPMLQLQRKLIFMGF